MASMVEEVGAVEGKAQAVEGPVSVAFLLAGKATFTVSNPKGERYTYRVSKVQDPGRKPVWFVGLLTGPQNESDYSYLGMVVTQGSRLTVKTTLRSKLKADAKPVAVLAWALRVIGAKGSYTPPQGYSILHSGHCGRCGRLLTVPESIALGLGPECAGKGA